LLTPNPNPTFLNSTSGSHRKCPGAVELGFKTEVFRF